MGAGVGAGELASAAVGGRGRQGSGGAKSAALCLALAAGLTLCAAGAEQRGLFKAPGAEAGSARGVGLGAWERIQAGLGWLWGGEEAKAPAADPEEGLHPLPLALPKEGEEGWGDLRLARELLPIDSFLALAVAVERLPKTGYMDSAGANVGAGYCLTRRMRDHGEARVREDLRRAGFDEASARALMSLDPKRVEATPVSQAQGLRLLALTKADYEGLAVKAVGSRLWSELAENKRAALSYLAYNTGNVGSFKKLLEAARRGDEAEALRQMSVAWRDRRGRAQKNHRLRAWAQAAWASHGTLGEAVRQPLIFELSFAGSRGQEGFIKAALKRTRGGEAQIKELRLSENLERRRQEQRQAERAEAQREQKKARAKGGKGAKARAALKESDPRERSGKAGLKPAGSGRQDLKKSGRIRA